MPILCGKAGEGGRGGRGGGGEERAGERRGERRTTELIIMQQRGNEISNFLDICVELDSVSHCPPDSRVPEN